MITIQSSHSLSQTLSDILINYPYFIPIIAPVATLMAMQLIKGLFE